MMKTAKSLTQFFGQFGYPVYLESDVPDDAELPYITIPLKDPDWRKKASYQIMVWGRTTSNLSLIEKADASTGAVGEGVRIPFEGGMVVLRMDSDTPTQIGADDDFRYVRIALTINAYHLPGV